MKILATDFDCTLKRNGRVSRKDLKAIQRFRKQGNLFGIVSGRSLGMLKPALWFFRIPFDFIIGDNGSFIVDHDFNLLYEKEIDFDKALSIIAQMKREQPGVAGFNDGFEYGLFTHGWNFWSLVKSFVVSIPSVSYKKILKRKKVLSFFLESSDPDQVQRIYDLYKDDPQLSCVRNGTKVVDLSAPGVDKAVACEELKRIFQCEEIIVIGDSANDIRMIKEHHGYAIRNAEKEVLAVTDKVVSDFEELVSQIEK